MKTDHIILLLPVLMLIWFASASAETGIEVGVSGGYNDNLFFDSTRTADSYTSPYLTVSLYPMASLELAAFGSYTAYRNTADLGSALVGANAAYIAYSDDSPFSFMLSGEVSTRQYGELYDDYDHVRGGASLALRYRLDDRISLKAGTDVSVGEYANAAIGNSRGYGIHGGLNAALPGSNSVDIEGGYDMTNFTDLVSEISRRTIAAADGVDIEDNLRTLYYSLRFSRPLAAHTGLSLEYSARHFVGDDDVVTYGLSVDNLSPWTAFWEGQAVSARIKSFIIPGVIVATGIEYRDIAFMNALESNIRTFIGEYGVSSRDDERYLVSLSIRRPFSTSGGGQVTPSLDITTTDNNSSHPLYDYTSLNVAVNLNLQF